MNDLLQTTYVNESLARNILESLENKFGQRSNTHIMGLWDRFTRTKLSEGGNAWDHVLKINAMCNELELFNSIIDPAFKIATILGSLPKSYQMIRDVYGISDFTWDIDTLIGKIDAQEDQKSRNDFLGAVETSGVKKPFPKN